MINLNQLGQYDTQGQSQDPFAQFGGSIEQPQATIPDPSNPTPATGAQSTQSTAAPTANMAPTITNPNDPAQVSAWFQWRASQPGADPILQTPGGVDYYTKQTLANGGLTDTNYWTNKSTLAQFGGAVGSQGGGMGFGSLTAPYTGSYSLPTAQDLQGMPGYQASLDAASKAVNTNAAARGLLNTGGTAKALQDAAIGTASQNYYNLANLGQNAFNTNYGIFRNNQQDPWNKIYSEQQLGLNAETA